MKKWWISLIALLVAFVFAGAFAEATNNLQGDVGSNKRRTLSSYSTPTDIPGTPTDIPGTPTDIPGTPTDIPGTPTDIPGTPTDIPSGPVTLIVNQSGEINGVKVTAIGREAFWNCTSLTSISIPEGVTRLGMDAFANCSALERVDLPASLTSIEYRCFNECASLDNVVLPDGLTYLAEQAFEYCYSLSSITIPSGVDYVPFRAFSDCYQLASVTLQDGVVRIGSEAFASCDSLRNITFPDSLRVIEDNAFKDAWSLRSIVFPDSLEEIGVRAFYMCDLLESATIPAHVANIGYLAFAYCYDLVIICYQGSAADDWAKQNNVPVLYLEADAADLSLEIDENGVITGYTGNAKEIVVPSSINGIQVTAIGDNAFEDCLSVESVTLPEGKHCSVCGEVLVAQETIPAKVHAITLSRTHYEMLVDETLVLTDFIIVCGHEGPVTLAGVSSDEQKAILEGNTLYAKESGLVYIDVTATLPDGLGSRFTLTVDVRTGKTMTLPAFLAEIGEEAFMGIGADEVILQEGITSIGPRAFANSRVRFITIPASVTDIAEDAFEGCDVTIIVPAGSKAEAFAEEHEIPCVVQ